MAHIGRIRLLCGLIVHHSPIGHPVLAFVNLRPRRTILATLTRNYASKSTTRSTPEKSKTRKRVPGYAIRTLDPTRLQASDFHDISHTRKPMYSTDREDVRGTVYRTLQKISYFIKEQDPHGVPFPPGTQGFLYYSWPLAPNSAPSSTVSSTDGNSQGIIKQQEHIEKLGQIRFRKTESSDPATFAKGTDLMLPSGVPWIMYPRPDPNTRETFFWKLILRDGMASTDVGITYPTFSRPISGPEVTTFGQPFSVRFNKTRIRCLLLSHKEQTRRSFLIHNPLRPWVENSSRKGSAEYSGTATYCFERSPLPEHRDPNTRFVVIRVLKIVKPIENLQHPQFGQPLLNRPVEGELLPSRRRPGIPWFYDVNDAKRNSVTRALNTLFENEMFEASGGSSESQSSAKGASS